ncbi:hypothetical protein Tco_0653548, partial [Tanacetum coccineum]
APFLNVKMMSDHNSSDLAPQRQEMSVENVSSGLLVPLSDRTSSVRQTKSLDTSHKPFWQDDLLKLKWILVELEGFAAWKAVRIFRCQQHQTGFVDPDHPEKSTNQERLVWILKQAHEPGVDGTIKLPDVKGFNKGMLIVPLYQARTTLKHNSRRRCHAGCLDSRKKLLSMVALSACCAQVMWYEDTTARLWLHLPTNTFVLQTLSQP